MGYDWSHMDWIKEDGLYTPKRKVNNRNSHLHPQSSGVSIVKKWNVQWSTNHLGKIWFVCGG